MKKNSYWSIILILLWLFIFISCAKEKGESNIEIKISAAASLTDVINEITAIYEKEHKVKFINNFASSSVLAKQIVQGYDADIYFSANKKWMDFLSEKGKTYKESERVFLNNTLMVIAPLESSLNIKNLSDLTKDNIQKISIGDPDHVPAGIYAKKSLENANIWNDIEKKCIGAPDVRAAMSYVENQTVDLGIVYKTDAMISKKVKQLLEITSPICPEIKYLSAIIRKEKSAPKKYITDFMEYIESDSAKKIFEKYGFVAK